MFIRSGGSEIYRVYIIDRGAETDASGDRWSAGFKLFGDWSKGRLFKSDRADHSTAGLIRRHFVQPFTFAVQDAAAGRRVHFVSGENVKIAIQILNIDGKMRHALRSIDQNRHTVFVSSGDH